MKRIACALICLFATLTVAVKSSAASAVSYAYVAYPTELAAYSVAANGQVTQLPGSPYAGIALNHLSVSGNYLFGPGHDNVHVYAYKRNADGTIDPKPVDVVNAKSHRNCSGLWSSQVSHDGTSLYVLQSGCQQEGDSLGLYIQTYRINEGGTLEFLSGIIDPFDNGTTAEKVSQLYFLADDTFAYQFSCQVINREFQGTYAVFERQSNGELVFHSAEIDNPDFGESAVCSATTDEANNVAGVEVNYQSPGTTPEFNSAKVTSFSSDANGDLTNENGFNVRTLSLPNGQVSAMSVSPDGKLLAVGGLGFQLFHWNGSAPVAYYSGVIQPSKQFSEFGWDTSNHLFALSTDGLRVYDATSSSYAEAPGSPIEKANATSMIVVAK